MVFYAIKGLNSIVISGYIKLIAQYKCFYTCIIPRMPDYSGFRANFIVRIIYTFEVNEILMLRHLFENQLLSYFGMVHALFLIKQCFIAMPSNWTQ